MLGSRYPETTPERRFNETEQTTEERTKRTAGDYNGRWRNAKRWRRTDVETERVLAIEPEIRCRIRLHETGGNVRPE